MAKRKALSRAITPPNVQNPPDLGCDVSRDDFRPGIHRMSAAISITRLDMTASELRNFAGKCGDGAQVRRLLAIALVLEHRSRAAAAALNGMDRQTLSDWVHRYNAAGIDGLKSGPPPCAAPPLGGDRQAECG